MTDVLRTADGLRFTRELASEDVEARVLRRTDLGQVERIPSEVDRRSRDFGASTAAERAGSDARETATRAASSGDNGPPDQPPARGIRAGLARFSERLNAFLDDLLAPLVPDRGGPDRSARQVDQQGMAS